MNLNATVDRSVLSQKRIYDFLKRSIITLQYRPGARLRAGEIAGLAESSRTPVREALSRLEQEGLVRRDNGWGYVVAEISVRDILNLFSVREALEVQAAIEAAPFLQPEAIDELAALNAQAEVFFDQRRYDDFMDQNRRFYLALARLTRNDLLQQMLGVIHDRVRLVGALILSVYESRAQEWLLENREILAAIRARDIDALVAALRAHIRRGRDHVLRHLHALDISPVKFPGAPREQ